MKKTIITALLAIIALAHAGAAKNYPENSDYLWVTVPDHDNWTYKVGEEAIIDVQFYKYGIPRDATIEYSIGGDCLPDDTHGKATMKRGKATINMGTSLKPGFRDLRLTANVDGKNCCSIVCEP